MELGAALALRAAIAFKSRRRLPSDRPSCSRSRSIEFRQDIEIDIVRLERVGILLQTYSHATNREDRSCLASLPPPTMPGLAHPNR